MDPLSVAASIVGLLAAGGKVTNLLFTVISKCKDSPKLAQSLVWEVADLSAALGHLQEFIGGRSRRLSERGNLILLDQLLTTLTGCVTTYSDLQSILNSLNVSEDMGAFDRIKWFRQEDKINSVVQRLQSHKSSLTLMLTIMQCKSMVEAQSCTQKLCVLVEQMLESNQDLAERIRGLERQGSIISKAPSDNTLQDDASTIKRANTMGDNIQLSEALQVKRFAFEDDLESSHVYNKAIYRHSQLSLTSTALYNTALSVFSKLSLSQISCISSYALPICAVDLSNSELYVFGEDGAALLELPTSSPPPTGPDHYASPADEEPQSHFYHEAAPESLFKATPMPTRKLSRTSLLGRFATPQRRIEVSAPENVVHVTHVGYDPVNGQFMIRTDLESQRNHVGLPKEWAQLISESGIPEKDGSHWVDLDELVGA